MAIRDLQQFNQDADMYGEDLVNLVNTPVTPQKTIQPVNQQTMAAPLVNPSVAAPSAYKYSGSNLEDYLAAQQTAFKPQLLQAGTYGITEGGEYSNPDVYSAFDPNKATQDYIGQRNAARTGIAPELSTLLSGMGQYQEYTDKLAKEIGYTGPKTYEIENPYFSGGTNESGESYSAPNVNQLHPDFLDALSGYKIENAVIGSNDPAVNIYKPDGSLMGKYRVGDNSETSFDRFMEKAMPIALGALTGGALAGPALGLLGVTAPGTLATGIATGAIGSGASTAIQGGSLKDVLRAAALGSITAGAGAGVSEVLGSAFAPAGYMPGEVAAGGIGTQIQSTISSGLQDIGLPADLANNLASYTKPIATSALKGGTGALIKGESVLSGLGEGLATGFSDAVTGKLFNSGVDLAAGQPVKDAVFDTLKSAGLSENAAGYVASLVKPVVSGGLSAALTGNDVFAGMGTGALNAVTKDVGKELGLNPAQSQIVANYLRTGDELALVSAFGSQLAGAVGKAAKDSAVKVDAGAGDSFDTGEGDDGGVDDILYPADSQTEVPQQVEITAPTPTTEDFLGPYYPADTQTEVPQPQQVEVTAPASAPTSYEELLATLEPAPAPAPYYPADTQTEVPQPQQVEVTGKSLGGDEDPYVYIPSLTGETSDITLGSEGNKVEVTGKVPVDNVLDLLPPTVEIPKLDTVAIPEVKIEDKPVVKPSTPTPRGSDNTGLFNALVGLAGSGQAPVSSQVLANMGRFDVDSLSQFLQEQKRNSAQQQPQQQSEQQQLFAMLEAMGFKG